jgi:hypothetical protein
MPAGVDAETHPPRLATSCGIGFSHHGVWVPRMNVPRYMDRSSKTSYKSVLEVLEQLS